MDNKKNDERRRFLQLSVGSLAAMAVPTSLISASASPATDELVKPELDRILTGPQRIHNLGVAYRESFPEEDDLNVLVDLLSSGVREKDLSASLDARSREDFERSRTVNVSGWVLSRTEARQCGLYSLLFG